MMKRTYTQTILLSFLLVSCAGLPVKAQSGEPFFHVITTNLDDQIKVQSEDHMTVIDITSPSGIGSATFELESGSMPRGITIQLHLQGLEEFRLSSSQDSIVASISSRDAVDVRQKIIESGNEVSIPSSHPLWMEIEIVPGQAEKKIPLEEGYFEIKVSKNFILQAGNSFEIEWIDFYR